MQNSNNIINNSEHYTAAYLALCFPKFFYECDYKSILTMCFQINSSVLFSYKHLIAENILIFDEGCIDIRKDLIKEVLDEFNHLASSKKEYILQVITNTINGFLKSTEYYELIILYLQLINNKNVNLKNDLEKLLQKFFSQSCICITTFNKFMDLIVQSTLLHDWHKAQIMSIVYKYNQNKKVVEIYESISNKKIIDDDLLLKVSSSYFMLNKIADANALLAKVEETDTKDTTGLTTTIEVIRLIYDYESSSAKEDKEKLINKFYKIIDKVKNFPNSANFLLKVSSSLLPHKESIQLHIKSNLTSNVVQIYNNVGALYFSMGHHDYISDNKNNHNLTNANKYLSFAKTLAKERDETCFYLELNYISLKFFNEYKKRSIAKNFKTIYKKFIQIKDMADSLYYKSIVLCNMLILEKLTTKNPKTINQLKTELNNIRNESKDFFVKQKILEFLNFNIKSNTPLPVWVITETHY